MVRHTQKPKFTAEIKRARRQLGNGQAAAGPDPLAAERHAEVMETLAALDRRIVGLGAAAARASQDVPEESAKPVFEAEKLRVELTALAESIVETKKELAALSHPDEKQDRITVATDELGAVVEATEQATETILNAAEKIEGATDKLRSHVADDKERAAVDDIGQQVTAIFEACNFQDITGQRITKVVNTFKYVEERVAMMIEILGGPEAFAGLALPDEVPTDADSALLSGPQLDEDDKISQDDIDSLFD